MEKKFVVTVSPEGTALGLMEKQEAHVKGVLHLAFSIFIFRKNEDRIELLIQQRAYSKYHSAGLWTNTCCSHAEDGISLEVTTQKRLQEEMGFSCPLQYAGSFLYKASVGQGLIEHEIDHVFVGFANPSTITLHPDEAENFEWISLPVLEERLQNNPEIFTAWFKEAYEKAKSLLITLL